MRRQFRRCIAIIAALVLVACAEVPATEPVARGRQIYQSLDCGKCHQVGGQGARLGPDLTRVGTVAGERRPGAGVEYLRQSIVDPGAYIVPGQRDTMPRGMVIGLSPADLDALIAYLSSLR